MALWHVEAIEVRYVRAVYTVEADNHQSAEEIARQGQILHSIYGEEQLVKRLIKGGRGGIVRVGEGKT
jgi:hypothetical protein